MDEAREDFERRLRDVAYTAVGLGVLAYKLSGPQRAKARSQVEQVWARHGDRCVTDVARFLDAVESRLRPPADQD